MNNEQIKFYNNSQIYFDTINKGGDDYFSEYLLFISYHILNLNSTILDVGCGTGQSTNYLAEKGYSVIGVDGGRRFTEQAKEKYKDQKFFCENADKLSFESNYFDVVASYNTVEHFSDVENSLKEMIRVVKVGGYVIINSPNLLSVWQPINAILKYEGESFEGINSMVCNIKFIFRNLFLIFVKSFQKKYNFIYRKPNFNFSFPDNDATWFINPVDIKNFFENNGCEIVVYQDLSHVKSRKTKFSLYMSFLFPGIMGITRVIARKI